MATFRSVIRHLTLQDGAQDGGRGKGLMHPAPWAEFIDHIFTTADDAVIKRLRALAPEHGITEAAVSAADPASAADEPPTPPAS